MAKIHDKFVIELAEVIKGYGNDPDVDDPFRLSEFYRFYELPEIAVSANHFKTMIPLEVVEKNAQPGWIPCTPETMPEEDGEYLCTVYRAIPPYHMFHPEENVYVKTVEVKEYRASSGFPSSVKAWQPKPKPWEGDANGKN